MPLEPYPYFVLSGCEVIVELSVQTHQFVVILLPLPMYLLGLVVSEPHCQELLTLLDEKEDIFYKLQITFKLFEISAHNNTILGQTRFLIVSQVECKDDVRIFSLGPVTATSLISSSL